MAQVRLEHVDKIYKGGVQAVQDLNLTIEDGEFMALLGPSGCGKTSTLRMIVGLEEITGGDIFIGERRMNKLEPSQRNVALAFETYALYPPLRVWENIAFCLRARGMDKGEIERRVKEVARILDITDILDRKPAELGGGQKQRISLARALVRDPDVFLLDEPLSHLDAAQRANMRVELKRLHATVKRTMVLVTHDQLEAIAMAERIAVMNFGVLQQVGTFDEVYNHPANEFVAGFIGEPPMNFLAAKPVRRGEDLCLVADDGSFDRVLPPMWRARVEQAQPKAIKLGVRPIDVRLGDGTPPPFRSIDIAARVKTYEALGEEGQLAAIVGDTEVLVVTPHDVHLNSGDNVTLHLNTNRVHMFDADTTRAI